MNVDSTSSLERPTPPAAGRRIEATRQRWQVLYEQIRSGHEPCYGTDQRLVCKETNCRWRESCVTMRAEWRR